MGSEYDIRLFFLNKGNNLLNRRRCKRTLSSMLNLATLNNVHILGELLEIKNLRPAITEPTITNNQTFFARSKLPSYCFHAVGPTSRNHNG